MKKIILASSSPRRKALFEQMNIKFEIDTSNYEEDMSLDLSASKLTEFLSLNKAKEVAPRHKNSIIVGADTVIEVDQEIFGKPHTPKRAKYMLNKLSNREHFVVTGFTIIDTTTGKTVSKSDKTKVFFKKLSEEEIDSYIETKEPLDKAGAYAIQSLASKFVTKIEGEYSTILGFSIKNMKETLKEFGIDFN